MRPDLARTLLRANELEERLEELRAAVQEAEALYEGGTPPAAIFARLRKTLEVVPAGRWDEDSCIEKAHEWNERYGAPPTAIEWNPAQLRARRRDQAMVDRYTEGDWPSLRTIHRLFGKWNSFLVDAGFEPRVGNDPANSGAGGGKPYGRFPVWTGWQMIPNFRERRGLTQATLAERANLNTEYIGMMERGTRTNPTVRILLALGLALEIGPRALMEYELSEPDDEAA